MLQEKSSVQRLFLADSDVDESVLLEKLVIALFTTVPGQAVVTQLINDAKRTNDVDGVECLIRMNDPYWVALFGTWATDKHILSLFLGWVLRNETDHIDLERYSDQSFKMAMRFLLTNQDPKFTAPLWDTSNILLDYLHNAKPLIESVLKKLDGSQFLQCLMKYNRLYEFNGSYQWFTPPQSTSHAESPTTILERNSTFLSTLGNFGNDMVRALSQLKTGDIRLNSLESYGKNSGHNNPPLSKQDDHNPLNLNGKSDRFNLFFKLGLHKEPHPLLAEQFNSLCLFADPMTQPPPNDSHIISLDLLHDLYLGSLTAYIVKLIPNYQKVWKIHLSANLETITLAILQMLQIWDYRSLDNLKDIQARSPDAYPKYMTSWIPYDLSPPEMEILYMIAGLSFYSMHKMHSDNPPRLNPFLPMMLRAWRGLSSALVLGLQIDRFEEMQMLYGTPVIVSAVIRGASALRSIIATILNGHVDEKLHDFKHQPFGGFMSPHGRKLCNGALYTYEMYYFAALLPSGMDYDEIVELLTDIQKGDRIDEDVRYMFDYEYFDYNDADTSKLTDGKLMFTSTKNELEQKNRFRMLRGLYKRCLCKFSDEDDNDDDDDDVDDDDYNGEKSVVGLDENGQINEAETPQTFSESSNAVAFTSLMTHRDSQNDFVSHLTTGYDKNGDDWRDIPRGLNLYYMDDYQFLSKLDKVSLFELLRRLPDRNVTFSQACTVLRSIATCVKLEQEQILLKLITATSAEVDLKVLPFSTDEVITAIFNDDGGIIKPFPFSGCNDSLGWKIFDELMMSHGHRRLLIYHLTHRSYTFSSIHYVYELLFGLRGNPARSYDLESTKNKQLGILSWTPTGEFERVAAIEFSRQGVIELSAIEKKMLLQEFFVGVSSGLLGEYNDAGFEAFSIKNPSKVYVDDYGEEFFSATSRKAEMSGKVKMVCFILEEVLNDKEFEFVPHEDYVYELKRFLMQWSTFSAEACSMYALLKSKALGKVLDLGTEGLDDRPNTDPDDQLLPVDFDKLKLSDIDDRWDTETDTSIENGDKTSIMSERFSRMLPVQSLDGQPVDKVFRHLLQKYPLTEGTPIHGRITLEYHDHILPLDIRTHQSLHREFLAVFDIDYLDILEARQQEAEEECDEMSI